MRILLTLIFLLSSAVAVAAGGGGGYPNDPAPVDLSNKASLQRGAQLYVNYCMGCHSMKFQRYSRLAQDLEISEELVEANLIFTPDTKIGDTMQIAMPEQDATQWFGALPPDLSVIARARGADYLYNYMRAFYVDESRPLGVNNSVKVVNMPHVLGELQGWQKPVYETTTDSAGHERQEIVGFELAEPGTLTPAEYDAAMGDLVNFLVYVGEPIQMERKRIGFWVLLYLFLALVVFYLLKKEYWKDVH